MRKVLDVHPPERSRIRAFFKPGKVLLYERMKEGQKVVCIEDAAPAHLRAHYTNWIKKGTVYVIRGVFLGVDYQSASAGEVGVYLLGIHNPKSNVAPFPERGFNAQRFRPIEELPNRVKKEEEVAF